MTNFNIELRTNISLHTDGEPSDFVTEYTGIITCLNDETDAVTKVGRLAAMRVHASLARNEGESLFDVCDCHSGELHCLHILLYRTLFSASAGAWCS